MFWASLAMRSSLCQINMGIRHRLNCRLLRERLIFWWGSVPRFATQAERWWSRLSTISLKRRQLRATSLCGRTRSTSSSTSSTKVRFNYSYRLARGWLASASFSQKTSLPNKNTSSSTPSKRARSLVLLRSSEKESASWPSKLAQKSTSAQNPPVVVPRLLRRGAWWTFCYPARNHKIIASLAKNEVITVDIDVLSLACIAQLLKCEVLWVGTPEADHIDDQGDPFRQGPPPAEPPIDSGKICGGIAGEEAQRDDRRAQEVTAETRHQRDLSGKRVIGWPVQDIQQLFKFHAAQQVFTQACQEGCSGFSLVNWRDENRLSLHHGLTEIKSARR
jgi:hypothetical protein